MAAVALVVVGIQLVGRFCSLTHAGLAATPVALLVLLLVVVVLVEVVGKATLVLQASA